MLRGDFMRARTRLGEIGFDATKPDGTMRKLLDVSRLYGANWRPKVDLRKGLELSYRDFLNNGN